MNLLIFLDLAYNPCKSFKFYSLQGQNVKTFHILPITRAKFFYSTYYPGGGGGQMYTWSPFGVATPLESVSGTVSARPWSICTVILLTPCHSPSPANLPKRSGDLP